MRPNRGVALILALLVLSFLTILGSALLTTATIDVWISENYKTATQNLYLTEAAIDQARDGLRVSANTATQLLTAAAGTDGLLATSPDLTVLLASDDQPLSCVLVRSGQEPVVVNLDIAVVEKPEEVHWVDDIHPGPKGR